MIELDSTRLKAMLTKCEETFGPLPVAVHDGKHIREVGRISVVEVVDNATSKRMVKSIVLRIGDPREMESFGVELREGRDEDWMQEHGSSSNEVATN